MTDISRIIRPLELILAHGAASLWRCKQVLERFLKSPKPIRPPRTPVSKNSSTRRASPNNSTPSLLPRRRLAIAPLMTTDSPSLVTAISFPSPSPQSLARIRTAVQSSRFSKVISNIDNQYHISGAMIQRLYGDEHGIYHDVGRPHPTSIHGFLRIVQRIHSPKIHILSDVLSQSILMSSLSPILSKYLRSCSTDLEWIFIPLHDRSDQRDPVWSLIGIHIAT